MPKKKEDKPNVINLRDMTITNFISLLICYKKIFFVAQ